MRATFPVSVNFVHQRGIVATLLWLGCVLILAVFAYCAWQYYDQTQHSISLQDAINQRQLAARPKPVQPLSEVEQQKLQAEIKSANLVIGVLAYPWGNLLSQLDQSVNNDVSLLAIQPDVANNKLGIQAEARNIPSMLAYVHELQSQPGFRQVSLVSQQFNQEDPLRPVRFTVSSTWDAEYVRQHASISTTSTISSHGLLLSPSLGTNTAEIAVERK